MISKDILLKQINNFPSILPVDELIERLKFIEILQKRIDSSKNHQSFSDEELDIEMKKWFE